MILLVELFRIHQQHWDELRRREIPSFEQFRADIAKLVGAAQTFQQQSSALLEAAAKPAAGPPCRENHPRRRDLRRARRLAGRLSHREGVAMKLDFIPFDPIILPPDIMLALRHPQYFLAARRNSSGVHRSLALVRSSKSQRLRRAARRSEVEAKSILSRLAHHRRHRLWQNQFRHQSTGPSSFSKRTDIGAACALTKKAFIGKRSRQWRVTTAANTI